MYFTFENACFCFKDSLVNPQPSARTHQAHQRCVRPNLKPVHGWRYPDCHGTVVRIQNTFRMDSTTLVSVEIIPNLAEPGKIWTDFEKRRVMHGRCEYEGHMIAHGISTRVLSSTTHPLNSRCPRVKPYPLVAYD